MNLQHNTIYKWGIFLVPALLLSTPNFSIAIIITSILSSLYYLYKNWSEIKIDKFDIIVMICFSFYLLGAIPVAIIDGSTGRYFQGGGRLILCIPVYLALSHLLKTSNLQLRNHLEWGVLFGSILSFLLAIYQYFYLSMPRVDGFLFSINFGYLSCSLAFLALTLSFDSTKRLWLILAFIIGIFSVVLTLTRGAIFAIPILFIFTALLNIRKLSIKVIVLGITTFIFSCIMTYNYSYKFQQRINFTIYEFSSIVSGNINQAASSGDRLQFWYGATEAFKVSPLTGLTYEEREEVNHKLYLEGKMDERPSKIPRGHAHSQYFEMLASNGILGIISIITTIFIPLSILIRHYVRYESPWALSGAVFVSGFAVFGLTEVPLTANLIGSYYGFMLAVFLATTSAEKYHWEQKHKL
ncbi:O-antigen ligase family protein [Vibrio tubiashii]|uniref:O-antigen ligase family protein n=1 Tax=Vibrio tubiashii TaxID=29498 RepID=UPI00349EFA26